MRKNGKAIGRNLDFKGFFELEKTIYTTFYTTLHQLNHFEEVQNMEKEMTFKEMLEQLNEEGQQLLIAKYYEVLNEQEAQRQQN